MNKVYLIVIAVISAIQTTKAQWTSGNGTTSTIDAVQIGSISTGYTPTQANWGCFILNSQNYSTIAFHHYRNRVDFIRTGYGTIQLGYDGGWGQANID